MNTERQMHEAIARCVSVLVDHHQVEPDRNEEARMASEIRAISETIARIDSPLMGDASAFGRPIEREIVFRYGPAAPSRMVENFLTAFRDDRPGIS